MIYQGASAPFFVGGIMIDTVVFDVGGVLVNFDRDIYFQRRGYDTRKANELTRAVFDHPAWLEYDLGNLSDTQIRERFKQDTPHLANEIERELTNLHGVISRKDTTIPWIQSLHKKEIKTYVLSNMGKTCIADNQDALDFVDWMDGCFWSYEHHVIKPNSEAFSVLCKQYHIDPKHSIFIDDMQRNVDVAKTLGFCGIWYQNQKQAERDILKSIQMTLADRFANYDGQTKQQEYWNDTSVGKEEIE